MKASRIDEDDDKQAMLLHFAGRKVQEIYSTLPEIDEAIPRGPMKEHCVPHMGKYESAVFRLNEFFLPKKNFTYERHVLRQMIQKDDESITMFATRLRLQAERCNFGTAFGENVKDHRKM